MRLTRLELSGFKSFAGAVELPFEAGVTAIVGPNGCGKSNISDAVRWVLGEQSPRLLRGGKMEDVIFQGSTGRRPVNVAEVSLVFDNADGTLPLAYQEVVVTRRLSRSGQSEYLLNRSPVRLRDVQDLLRGTGLGADAAVVMEARMIEALLSEKAEERRALFEEAAGIGLYRDRKKSTERRLEETAADLARLDDLVSEVQTQVRSLARQRGKAERYGKMIEERFGIALTLVRRELANRTALEQDVRDRLLAQRAAVRELEENLQRRAEAFRALEGERAALERERAELRQQLGQASHERSTRDAAERAAAAEASALAQRATAQAQAASAAAEAVEQARRRVAGLKEQETHDRATRRQAEEALAQVTARRDALVDLERERVGLAPAAQALLRDKAHFGDAVVGPLADFVRTSRHDAELAERLLGEWLHAVLVRDAAAIDVVRQWHDQVRPGPLVLLPCVPGPRRAADGHPLEDRLRVDGPAAAWVRALLAGHEVLDGSRGAVLRRPNGAVFLDGGPAAGSGGGGGPLQRRAEIEALEQDVREAEGARGRAAAALEYTLAELANADTAFTAAGVEAEQARQAELEAGALKGDAERATAHARREATDAAGQVERLSRRLGEVEARLTTLHAELEGHEVERVRLDERLGAERARLAELEAQQEAAREQRVQWQVDAAQVEARLAGARERAARAAADAEEGRRQGASLVEEIAAIDRDTVALTAQQAQWQDALRERKAALGALAAAATDAGRQVQAGESGLAEAEGTLADVRRGLDALGTEEHKLELERTEILGRKRGLVERVEAEWRKPLDQLLTGALVGAGDLPALPQENERLQGAIDAVGPVNALAVEEHAEEMKRLEFL